MTDFMRMASGRGRSAAENEIMAITGLLLEFSHAIKGASPGQVVEGQALVSSIKAGSAIVYDYESRLDTISKLEALKIGYAPPVTIEQRAAASKPGGRLPTSTMNFGKIKSEAMFRELNQFIDGYKRQYPIPAGYDGIKSKLTDDIGRLKNLRHNIGASFSRGGAASTPAETAAANTQPAKLKTKNKGKKGSVAKLKKKNR